MGRRPDSTPAPIPMWAEYDTGLEWSATPPPYSMEPSANPSPTLLRYSSTQKHAYEAQPSGYPSDALHGAGTASASNSLLELDVGEGSIIPPGETGVTRMYNHRSVQSNSLRPPQIMGASTSTSSPGSRRRLSSLSQRRAKSRSNPADASPSIEAGVSV